MERTVQVIAPRVEAVFERKRVAAYARVSSGKDAMLHSLSAQVSYYNNLIGRNKEWEFAGIYADEAITGTKDTRSEFKRLIEDCKSGKIDMVITKSISRFARNTVTLLETVRMLKELNVDVFFEEQNIHSMSGDGELMLTILASFAQEESLSVSENCKWRIRNDFKNGKLPMNIQRLYGYKRTKDGGFEIIESEAKVVQYIFDRYLKGDGCTKIAKTLKKKNIPPPRDRWVRGTVMYIIQNEKYAGDLLLQKSFYDNHISKKNIKNTGQLDRYYVEDNHPPIISREVFEEVQKEMKRRAEKCAHSDTSKKQYPFTGYIRCENCGAHYRRKVSNSGNKYRRVFWNCATYLSDGKDACYTKQIPEDELLKLTSEVLGITEFDETIFKNNIKEVTVPEWNKVTFVFYDGRKVTKEWKDKSRKWTDEMKNKNYYNLRKGKYYENDSNSCNTQIQYRCRNINSKKKGSGLCQSINRFRGTANKLCSTGGLLYKENSR